MRTEARAGRREGVGQRRRKRHACGEGSAQEALGARTRAERTLNMPYMLVTLEVSKLRAVGGCDGDGAPRREARRLGAVARDFQHFHGPVGRDLIT